MIAREKAKLTLHRAGNYLVTQVENDLTGLFFIIVPIMGTTQTGIASLAFSRAPFSRRATPCRAADALHHVLY